MTRETIAEKLSTLTPRELQHVISTIQSWNSADYDFDERAGAVKTAEDVVELLSDDEYNYSHSPVDEYFMDVFGV